LNAFLRVRCEKVVRADAASQEMLTLTLSLSRCSLSVPYADEGIQDVVIVGLATDYCVKATTLDVLKVASRLESLENVYVVREAVRGVDAAASLAALEELAQAGARIVSMGDEELAAFLGTERE
jgi:nicotinamidase/pyrazinamidase